MKLNLGCGLDYRKGYVNVDSNRNINADLYCDLEKPLPFKDNSIEEIICEGTIEHISKDKIFAFMQEMHRICRPHATIKILTNHFTSVWAFQHLDHQCYFGVDSFSIMEEDSVFTGERYNDAVFKIRKIRLHFFYPKMFKFNFLSKLPIDWLFNFNRTWQRIMERFMFLGFDGIYYELEVIK